MNTNPGLKFITVIAVILCAAIAIRVFAAGKHYQQRAPFKLVIEERTEMKRGTSANEARNLLKNGINCDMDFKAPGTETLDPLCGPATTAKRTENLAHASGPHIQQKVEFTRISDLKALVAALATTASTKPPPSPAKPETSASPAPHVSQQVESNTPHAAKAIAEALALGR
jgi:hypothetical protein